MNNNRGLSLAWIGAIVASIGDSLLLFVGNAVNAGSLVQSSETLLALGGLLGCVAMPCMGLGMRPWREPCPGRPGRQAR